MEGLGRARGVPIAYEGSIIVLRHSMPTKAKKIIVNTLEVSKKKVIALATQGKFCLIVLNKILLLQQNSIWATLKAKLF